MLKQSKNEKGCAASVETLVASVIEVYPEIKLKSKRAEQVRELILSYYKSDF
jgi:hypothetical protein